MIPRPKRRGPRFIWQALLVLAPTLLLGAIGLEFLRRDWTWTQREGALQAAQAANELALVRLPNALRCELPPFDARAHLELTRWGGDRDPILSFSKARHPRIGFVLDEGGKLIYPPPVTDWPPARPVEPTSLAPALRSSWNAIAQRTGPVEPPEPTIIGFKLFLGQNPPPPFAALATYRLGVLLERHGDADAARRHYEQIIQKFPDVPAESGLPLRTFAGLRLVQPEFLTNSTAAQRAGLISWLAADALFRPTPISPLILKRLQSLQADSETVANPCTVWEAHEQARNAYTHLFGAGTAPGSPTRQNSPYWTQDDEGPTWLAIPQRDGVNRWIFFMTEATVRRIVNEALAAYAIPSYFKASAEIAGRPLVPKPVGGARLALVTSSHELNSPVPGISASIYLSDPAAFYGHARAQRAWIGTLILLSMIAVAAGVLSVGRTFGRQRQLAEMKGNFVSSVSHELRAPIASIRLMAEELADSNMTRPGQPHEYHELMVRECKRVSALIDNVLDFSRYEQGRQAEPFEPTDLAELIEETVRVMRPSAAEKQIALRTEIGGGLRPISAVPKALQRALINLVDNAIKYSPAGSGVTVGVQFAPPNGSGQAEARLWVEDQGIGIPPEEQEQVFEQFYRRGSELQRESHGVGLGLAIVKQVMHAHGGRVALRSQVGQGSRFTLTLPVPEKGAAAG